MDSSKILDVVFSVTKQLRGKRMKIADLETENATLKKNLASLVDGHEQVKQVSNLALSQANNEQCDGAEKTVQQASTSQQFQGILKNMLERDDSIQSLPSARAENIRFSTGKSVQGAAHSNRVMQRCPQQPPVSHSNQPVSSMNTHSLPQKFPHTQQQPLQSPTAAQSQGNQHLQSPNSQLQQCSLYRKNPQIPNTNMQQFAAGVRHPQFSNPQTQQPTHGHQLPQPRNTQSQQWTHGQHLRQSQDNQSQHPAHGQHLHQSPNNQLQHPIHGQHLRQSLNNQSQHPAHGQHFRQSPNNQSQHPVHGQQLPHPPIAQPQQPAQSQQLTQPLDNQSQHPACSRQQLQPLNPNSQQVDLPPTDFAELENFLHTIENQFDTSQTVSISQTHHKSMQTKPVQQANFPKVNQDSSDKQVVETNVNINVNYATSIRTIQPQHPVPAVEHQVRSFQAGQQIHNAQQPSHQGIQHVQKIPDSTFLQSPQQQQQSVQFNHQRQPFQQPPQNILPNYQKSLQTQKPHTVQTQSLQQSYPQARERVPQQPVPTVQQSFHSSLPSQQKLYQQMQGSHQQQQSPQQITMPQRQIPPQSVQNTTNQHVHQNSISCPQLVQSSQMQPLQRPPQGQQNVQVHQGQLAQQMPLSFQRSRQSQHMPGNPHPKESEDKHSSGPQQYPRLLQPQQTFPRSQQPSRTYQNAQRLQLAIQRPDHVRPVCVAQGTHPLNKIPRHAMPCPPPLYRPPSTVLQSIRQPRISPQQLSQSVLPCNAPQASIPNQQPIVNQQIFQCPAISPISDSTHSKQGFQTQNQSPANTGNVSSTSSKSAQHQETTQNCVQHEVPGHAGHCKALPPARQHHNLSSQQQTLQQQEPLRQMVSLGQRDSQSQENLIQQSPNAVQNDHSESLKQNQSHVNSSLCSRENPQEIADVHLQKDKASSQKGQIHHSDDELVLCGDNIIGPFEEIVKEEQEESTVTASEESLDVSAFLDLENISNTSFASRSSNYQIPTSVRNNKNHVFCEPNVEKTLDFPPHSIVAPQTCIPSVSKMDIISSGLSANGPFKKIFSDQNCLAAGPIDVDGACDDAEETLKDRHHSTYSKMVSDTSLPDPGSISHSVVTHISSSSCTVSLSQCKVSLNTVTTHMQTKDVGSVHSRSQAIDSVDSLPLAETRDVNAHSQTKTRHTSGTVPQVQTRIPSPSLCVDTPSTEGKSITVGGTSNTNIGTLINCASTESENPDSEVDGNVSSASKDICLSQEDECEGSSDCETSSQSFDSDSEESSFCSDADVSIVSETVSLSPEGECTIFADSETSSETDDVVSQATDISRGNVTPELKLTTSACKSRSSLMGFGDAEMLVDSLAELDDVVETVHVIDKISKKRKSSSGDVFTPDVLECCKTKDNIEGNYTVNQRESNLESNDQLCSILERNIGSGASECDFLSNLDTDSLSSKQELRIYISVDSETGRMENTSSIPEQCPLCYSPLCPSAFTVNVCSFDLKTVCLCCDLIILILWGKESDFEAVIESPCPKSKKRKFEGF